MCRGMPAILAIPSDHPVDVAPADALAGDRTQDQWNAGPLPTAGLEHVERGDGQEHGGGLVALADHLQHRVGAQSVGVVLDPPRGRFRCAQSVDAQKVGQGAVVDGDAWATWRNRSRSSRSSAWVRDSSRLTLGSRPQTAGVGADQAVDVGETEVAPDGCIIVLTEESISGRSPS